MNFEPTSEGFLDFFKKKSKQPSKVEKSNILNKMTPGKSINYGEISQKLADMYPDDAKKEFDNRRKYLKTILNAITEVSKKYKNIPGIEFDSAINTIKCFIAGKDYEDNDTGWDEIYEEFLFMHDILPICTPKEDDFSWAYTSKFYLSIFNYDIWDWAENGPYKNDFKSNKKLVRDFDDTAEWWSILENITKDIENKLKGSEFFYKVDCGGDWDDGSYEIILKPSKSIQSLAERCSKYKSF